MMLRNGLLWFGCSALLAQAVVARSAEVTAKLQVPSSSNHKHATAPPAVIWLKPVSAEGNVAVPGKFTLLQKDKMFTPHLLVVPVGSTVAFPNADPFFHNVFSLFDGRRFDLGMYEAGRTRNVVFSREGVSYIFCNIHPDMSAVVISLSTPFFAIADAQGIFHLKDVPAGDYELHVWVEGNREPVLNKLTRRIHVEESGANLGSIQMEQPAKEQRLNKFGEPYKPQPADTY